MTIIIIAPMPMPECVADFDDLQKVTDYLITFAKTKTSDNITVIIVFLKDPQTIIKETPFIEKIEAKARKQSYQNMEINGAESNGFLAENASIALEDREAFDDIQNFMVESAILEPKSASTLCVGPMDDMGFLSDGGLGPETDVDGVHDSKQQSPSPMLDEPVKSSLLDNGDIAHEIAMVESVEQQTMDHHNPFAPSVDAAMDLPTNLNEANTNAFEEEEPTSPSSVSADPTDMSEEQMVHAVPHVNGNGEHHHDDEPSEVEEELLGAAEKENVEEMVPALKAELNDDEIVPLKSIDEPIVNDLLGGDSIVDNKLIDQLDSFGISEAIRRQLIDQQVTGPTMHHEQDEDDDDGQIVAEDKQSEFDDIDDGAEKEDLHHEKPFDGEFGNDHSVDVKQDDDAGCGEDSEEDEWNYVNVNQQQQQQQLEPTHESQQESAPHSEQITNTVEISNSLVVDEQPQKLNDDDDEPQWVQKELEQHGEQEHEHEQEQQEKVPQELEQEVDLQEREKVEEHDLGEVEHHDETTAEPNTSEPVTDILGECYTETTGAECLKEVDDVISSTGGETKEVVNLLNDFEQDVPPPTTAETLCDTNDIVNEEISESTPFVPSDSANMEASMYGGSVADQPLSPESPMSPVDNFNEQQQHKQQYNQNPFGASMDEAMSPTADGEEMTEKHLYETEEKMMNLQEHQQQQEDNGTVGDHSWQLNPDAKEFVPVTGLPVAAEVGAKMHENIKMRDDAIVAQSPRKGSMASMEDLDVPAETVFQTEMDKRPHEFEEFGANVADDTTGQQHLQSPLGSVHPFDLSRFNDQTVVEQSVYGASNGVDMQNGVSANYLLQVDDNVDELLEPTNASNYNETEATAPTEEQDLLNKVQNLPDDEEDKAQEAPIEAAQQPVTEEDLFETISQAETYSAKEELNVEQKETEDKLTSADELVRTVDALTLQESYGYGNDHTGQEFIPKSAVSDISQSPEYKMLESSIEEMVSKAKERSGSSSPCQESVPTQLLKESSALEASVYDPQPGLISGECPVVPSESPFEPNQQQQHHQEALVAENAFGQNVTSVSEQPLTALSEQIPKDSATKTAPRVGTTSTTGAARKTPVAATAKKAPTTTTTSKSSTTAATTNGGVKERPASAASSKPSLGAKKPTTDTAKTATTKTTSTTSSVAAARAKVSSASSATTTKPASASSATRTAAPKPAGTTATSSGATAGKTTSSRLSSTTSTTTRTFTSRPSSAVSSASVPSKTTSATTMAKRTVTTKSTLTNGTTTDGASKTTKSSITSTTSSSTVPRTGATRTAGVATKTSSTLTAKKTLDVKPTATKSATSTVSSKAATTTRASLAPKTTATSPAVRKVQQNGVAKKSPAASPASAAGVKKAVGTKPQPQTAASPTNATTTTTAAPEVAATNGTAVNESVDVALADPPQQATDQLLVPVPQAM
uniref:Ataxin-2 C-terminal domain-containing protein n=1 Tax=Anopheles farauti TaxID=69004 RepID=A0A182QQR8_9DIPT